MKKLIMMLSMSLISFILAAQGQNADYNVKGDDAMDILDLSEAKVWYQLGVEDQRCDKYSISKLTHIWKIDKSMRASMHSVMERCLKCLTDFSIQNKDSASIELLVDYYSEGIGTNINETRAEVWKSRLEEIRNKSLITNGQTEVKAKREKVKMEFFAGYAATLEAPFGLTFGGVGRVVGWYLRFRTNMSFQEYDEPRFALNADGVPSIIGGLNNEITDFTGEKIYNTYAGTGGLVFKVAPSFYISVGGGYGKREFLAKYNKINIVDANYDPSGPFWAKSGYSNKASFDGAVVDLDGTFKIGKTFYGSLGCTMFDFKYLSANAGIGVFF